MTINKNNSNVPKVVLGIAKKLNISLDFEQLHIGGERAVMSPNKYVLTGTNTESSKRIVMKCSNVNAGVAEIQTEHKVRTVLLNISFAEQELSISSEIYFGDIDGYTVSVIEFIKQSQVFTNHPLREQFFMALQAFESQESFHATTRKHYKNIMSIFPEFTADTYAEDFENFTLNVSRHSHNDSVTSIMALARNFIVENKSVISIYNGYLIHSDFVPHNFRIKDRKLFLLDFVAFSFGNKYESWARFINFMEVHNPQLVPLLLEYVKEDRGENESLALRLMRIYKIGFLLNFYTNSLVKTTNDLHTLTKERIVFWGYVLDSVLKNIPTEQKMYATYIIARNTLRTEKEKRRQREFTNA